MPSLTDRLHDAESMYEALLGVSENGNAEAAVLGYGAAEKITAMIAGRGRMMPAFPVARAEVNHGRWIVRCPLRAGGWPCGGAQYASREDRRYFCLTCLNHDVDGAFLAVRWPEMETLGEAVLLRRPEANRNWVEGETVGDLIAENNAHLIEEA